jgi:hypothetical protein
MRCPSRHVRQPLATARDDRLAAPLPVGSYPPRRNPSPARVDPPTGR